jgi:AcrR family transcriptional regulator
MNNAPEPAAAAGDDLASRILDTALELGETRGWDAVHLHEIARIIGIDLADLRRHYDRKDAIAEAWFDRADAALLAAPRAPEWTDLAVRERLHRAIFSWLEALAPHRRVSAAMLRYKLQPGHIHLQALGLARVSRTVQWIREAACLAAVEWRRELEEVALTAIFLSTLAYWLTDESPGAERTHALLGRLLAAADWAATRLAT